MRTAVTHASFHRILALLLCVATSILFNCSDESSNFFEVENVIENGGLGQMEAYDALEVDYLTEFYFTHRHINVIVDECASYYNDAANKTITMIFGCPSASPTASKFPFTRVRSGRLYVKYETTVSDSLASRTITFDNYFVSAKKLEGSIRLDSIYRDTVGLLHSVCHFSKFKVTYPNGTSVTFSGSQERVWNTGEGDANPVNNTYIIIPRIDSLAVSGPVVHTFFSHISSSVRLNFACAEPGNFAGGSGAVRVSDISGYGSNTGLVNYGDGTCDAFVLVTTAQRTYPISVD